MVVTKNWARKMKRVMLTKLSNFSSNGQTRITADFCGCRAQAAKKRTKWKKLEAISTEKSWEDQTPTRISAWLNSLSWYYFTQYAVSPIMSSAQILFFFRGFFLFQVEMKDGYVTNYYSDTYPGLIVRLEFRRKLHYHLLQVSSCSIF